MLHCKNVLNTRLPGEVVKEDKNTVTSVGEVVVTEASTVPAAIIKESNARDVAMAVA